MSRPSTPIVVEITGEPIAIASNALMRVPPPTRIGMTHAAARATYGRTSSTRPGGLVYFSTANSLCPVQNEFDLPLYSWYPGFLKRRYEKLAVTTRPELVNHAKYPAVNWFTYYGLRRALRERQIVSRDRFDLLALQPHGFPVRAVVQFIRAVPPLRWLGHVMTPYVVVVGRKEGASR